ncbi:MAG: sigma-70 family RNA polymerase sigma factor [Duncaniella sp.]|nr:sigma-70 family RNA polymerase sigma factor [Duncaniella sp.]
MKQSILASTFISIRQRLHAMAAGIVGNDDEADDVLHDAFCRLWTRHPDVTDEVAAMKLSYTAVKNSAIDSFRRSQAHPHVQIDTSTTDMVDEADEKTDGEATYSAVLRLSERVLNPRQLSVFRLHDIEGLTFGEVAEELGMSPEYVRVTLSRSRKIIRDIYRQQQASEL